MALDRAGNILVSDLGNSRIRVIAARTGRFYGRHMTVGDIYLLAGGGTSPADGIPATRAQIAPGGLAVDGNGNVLVADSLSVRVVAARTGTFYGQPMTAGDIYTLKPTPVGRPSGWTPVAVAVDHAGNIVVDSLAVIQVIAVKAGRFYGITMRPDHIYIVAGTGRIGLSGDRGPAKKAELNWASAVAVDAAGNLLIADSVNARVRVVAERSGAFYGVRMRADSIYTVAGSGQPYVAGAWGGFSGDGGPATKAMLFAPCGVAPYGKGLLVLDDRNFRLREVSG